MFFLALAVVFTGCKKDDKEPVLDTRATVNPTWVTTPSPEDYFLFTKDSADVEFTSVEWTKVVYPLTNIPSPLYSVQVVFSTGLEGDYAWINPVDIFTTADLTTAIKQKEVNTAINDEIGNDYPLDTVITIGMRIRANVNANDVSHIIDAFTEIAPFDVTPYPITAPPLYLLGGATTIGWNNADSSLQFSYDEASEVYKIVATLSPDDPFYKALEVPGEWAPQWGTDESATWETGPLVYRPTEDVPDPAALPAPPDLGDYLITFDLVNKIYNVEVADIAQTMHLVGDATIAGWDAASAIPMTKIAPGIFEIETTLSADASEGFKFLVNQGEWEPMYGTVEGASFESGILVYRAPGDPDVTPIPPPTTTGMYKIVVNIVGMSYTVTAY